MKYKFKVFFTKKSDMKYVSHLDLIRIFGRALRRSGVPFFVTEGFSPHPKFSIKRALKVGVESDNEEAVFILRSDMPALEFKTKLKPQLPEGIDIKDVQRDFN